MLTLILAIVAALFVGAAIGMRIMSLYIAPAGTRPPRDE